jgi:lysophospholipase L1-like esterase
MQIAFFGDSLTFGAPGVSFLKLLEKTFPNHDLLNYGQGGDTALSLYRRIRELPAKKYDMVFLWVGVNDELVHASWAYPLLKKLRSQPWAKNLKEFETTYRRLVDLLCSRTRSLVTVTPLLIGEDIHNPWNRNLARMAESIRKLGEEYSNVQCIDIRHEILPQLKGKDASSFFPRSVFRILRDMAKFKTGREVDAESKNRKLYFTLDGIHLNQKGAEIAAALFAEAIRNFEARAE